MEEEKDTKGVNEGMFRCFFRRIGVISAIVLFGALVWLVLLIFAATLAKGFQVLSSWDLANLPTFAKLIVLFFLVYAVVLSLFWLFESRLQMPLEDVANSIAEWFRAYDWACHRTGDRKGTFRTFIFLSGHGITPTILSISLIFILVSGGRVFSMGFAAYTLISIGAFAILATNKWWHVSRAQYFPHLMVIFAVSAVVFFWPFSSDDYERITTETVYRHTWIPVFWGVALLLLFAQWLSGRLFKKYTRRFGSSQHTPSSECDSHHNSSQLSICTADSEIPKVLLIPGEGASNGLDIWRFARSLAKVPVFRFFEIVFWPSLVVVGIANWELMGKAALVLGVTAWVVYALGDMHEGLNGYLLSWKRILFRGIPAVVSVIMISLAAGRLFDNSYIRTVVEGGESIAGSTNPILLFYLSSAYVLASYLGYWTNRFVTQYLIGMFADSGNPSQEPTLIKVRFKHSKEILDGVIKMLEADRYALLDTTAVPPKPIRARRILSRTQLISEFIHDKDKVDLTGIASNPKVTFLSGRVFKRALHHRMRFYFTFILLLFGAALGGVSYWFHSFPQSAQLTVSELPINRQPGLFSLREKLFEPGRWNNRSPILLAASGGGTRAALYTYSLMGGLQDADLLRDVVLASGVSGGSAAIAYFSMHRNQLLQREEQTALAYASSDLVVKNRATEPWQRFGDVMVSPFIQDALAGLSEWRMAFGCSKAGRMHGLRLGVQLQESFDRRFSPGSTDHGVIYTRGCESDKGLDLKIESSGTDARTNSVLMLGQQTQLGLIFNTTLAGMLECDAKGNCNGTNLRNESNIDSLEKSHTSSFGKGGRLILTNLTFERRGDDTEGPFPDAADALPGAPNEYLTYRVLNAPDIPIVSAAALSANFPPVFPNAAVDLEQPGIKRYWITDGGANDNRGILSLLYALEGAIDEQSEIAGAHIGDPSDLKLSIEESHTFSSVCLGSKTGKYPTIYIIVAEASALHPAYQQDRGISARFGGAERFASQLIVNGVKRIALKYELLGGGGVCFHNLQMPLTLRSAGGIGTHWMLPRNLTLRKPFGFVDLPGDSEIDPGVLGGLFRLTEPGLEISGAHARQLVERLHRVPQGNLDRASGCAAPKRANDSTCAKLKLIWRQWICRDPQKPAYADSCKPYDTESMQQLYGTQANKRLGPSCC